MKVLMLNGSRKERGCTYTALSLVGESLAEAGIETEIVHIGVDVLKGKVDALVKEVGEKGALADGLVIGSPVYYAGPSGEIKAFLDRLFSGYAEAFRYKPGAAVTSARRAGTTATLEVLQKYLTYTEMPLVSSCYWPMVHGSKPEDVM
ncbi:MAG: flavodoxin family protein, partial [Coriobacteriaceae bacterium]|nr:flavodoxin family protein [Coriobacteriaceae bacterium]